MEDRILMKWRKNWQLAAILFIFIPMFCLCFISAYFDIRKDPSFLIISSILFVLFIILLVTSLKWNELLYMDEEKIWIKRKEKIIEWKIEDVISCRMVLRPRWVRYPLPHIEIVTKSNSKKLSFEWNNKIEKQLLEITKGKEVWKIFNKAFK